MTVSKLASLELRGYKTFAKETNLVFPARVTAIVGPNGSGKSNVADAIRWVLGEQSYSLLRAKKTEDMIYSGSDARARAGMASVSITFDNQEAWLPIDYSEVVLTRRAYRDGQNEYLINNQRVRLKDFHELLAKTGLGDRTYTIIGQGLVDLALSIKPDERRKLFEEAAGIGLYRARKEEALRRLETTQRNLERASDIVDEIRPRLRSLEKQAVRVSEFKTVQESFKLNLRDWYGYHWFRSQDEIAVIQKQLESAASDSSTTQKALDGQKLAVAAKREQIEMQRAEVSTLQTSLRDNRDVYHAKTQELAILEERKHAAQAAEAQSHADLGVLEETVRAGAKNLESSLAELERVQTELNTIGAQFQAAKKSLEKSRTEKQALDRRRSELQSKLINAEKESAVMRSRRTEVEDRLANYGKTIQSNEESIRGLSTQVDQLVAERVSHEASLEKFQASFNKIDEEQRQLAEEADGIKKVLDGNHARINKLNLDRNKLANQLELLRQGRESLAGFSEGARSILKRSQGQKSSRQITDLVTRLNVPKEYERAIGAALGEAIDVLVVQGSTLDNDLLSELSRDAGSRVAVIGQQPTRKFQPKNLPENCPGVISLAHKAISDTSGLEGVLQALLGDFVIVEDLPAAARLCQTLDDFNLVTLDGEVILKNGVSLLGRSNGSSKVSYSRVSLELEESISSADEALEKAREVDRLEQARLETINTQMRENNQRRQAVNIELTAAQKQVNTLAINADKLASQKAWIARQNEDSQRMIESVRAELAKLAKKADENSQLTTILTKELDEVRKVQKTAQSDDLERQHAYLQTETQILTQSLAHARVTHNNTAERLKADNNRLEQLRGRLAAQVSSIDEINTKVEAGRIETELLQQAIEQLETAELSPRAKSLAALETEYREMTDADLENQRSLSLKERQVTHFQLELARQQEKLETLRGRIEDDFGLIELEYKSEYSKSVPLPFPDLVIESLRETAVLPEGIEEDMRQQKAQMRRIGAVNLEAEKEYLEVKERFTNLTAQTADLNAAIADIQKMVRDLDEVMKREFLKTYKAVSLEFTSMFSRLFNGGSARLVLLDEDSPIEGGIDIEARLPGKREQGLVLLSGGERSLTAVALVFALLKISPTPFCVLDEVDAMLDESNVGRFIDLLRDLSTETQFILITHNRNTVSAADVIYGVTMGKDSTSQVISLMLDEVDESYVK